MGWFSSGTGAAGFVGASAWWIVRPLGVRAGLLSLIFLPFLMTIAYGLVLPTVEEIQDCESDRQGEYAPIFDGDRASEDDEEQEHSRAPSVSRDEARRQSTSSRRTSLEADTAPVPLSVSPHASTISSIEHAKGSESDVVLSLADKMQLIKPMLFVFILPLILVYFFE